MALVIGALVIGSSIVMAVRGRPTLFGLPAFGFPGFFGAVVCGLWLVRAIWCSSHHRNGESTAIEPIHRALCRALYGHFTALGKNNCSPPIL